MASKDAREYLENRIEGHEEEIADFRRKVANTGEPLARMARWAELETAATAEILLEQMNELLDAIYRANTDGSGYSLADLRNHAAKLRETLISDCCRFAQKPHSTPFEASATAQSVTLLNTFLEKLGA